MSLVLTHLCPLQMVEREKAELSRVHAQQEQNMKMQLICTKENADSIVLRINEQHSEQVHIDTGAKHIL